jgi:uncharacterized protein YycO
MGAPAAKWIRLGQWLNGDGYENYEHAFVFVGTGIVEAEPGGAKLHTLSEYPATGIDWSTGHFDLTSTQRTAIVKAALGYVGTPYSFADYGALVAHRLNLPLPFLKTFVQTSKHMICSQLVDQCYQDAGVHLFTDGRWPGYVTPGSLYDLLGAK